MTALILADDDSCERRITDEPADIVISCGDLPDDLICRVAKKVRASHVLAVKGNHDSSGKFPSPIVDLHLQEFTIAGIRFGGFGGAWRYKPRGNFLFDQHEVTDLLASFPPVDLFIAHNAPRGIHDREDDVHHGFDAFNKYIERAQPRILIHGHQHLNRETQIAATTVIGVYGFRRMTIG